MARLPGPARPCDPVPACRPAALPPGTAGASGYRSLISGLIARTTTYSGGRETPSGRLALVRGDRRAALLAALSWFSLVICWSPGLASPAHGRPDQRD